MAASVTKTSAEVQDYTLNWASDLGTDLIVTSTWASSDSALGVASPVPTIDSTNTKTTVWLSGGTVGQTYAVTNTITTNAGRTMSDSFPVYIEQFNFL